MYIKSREIYNSSPFSSFHKKWLALVISRCVQRQYVNRPLPISSTFSASHSRCSQRERETSLRECSKLSTVQLRKIHRRRIHVSLASSMNAAAHLYTVIQYSVPHVLSFASNVNRPLPVSSTLSASPSGQYQ